MKINSKIAELEALLYLYSDPITIDEVAKYLDVSQQDAASIINQYELQLKMENRGLTLLRFGNKIQLTTKAVYAEKLKETLNPPIRKSVSQAMVECLIIIAMNQPTLKAEVENIRGVKSDSSIARLQEMGLIKVFDRLDCIGRPLRYATTDEFLKYFGFHSIEEFQQTIKMKSTQKVEDDVNED